jgi:hypothetical protein
MTGLITTETLKYLRDKKKSALKAYEEGKKAKAKGIPCDKNPHKLGSIEFGTWEYGWKET